MISGFRSLVSGLYASGLQSPVSGLCTVCGLRSIYGIQSKYGLRSPGSGKIYGLLSPHAFWSRDASLRFCVKHNATRKWGRPTMGRGWDEWWGEGGMLIRLKFRTHFSNVFWFWSRNAISFRLPVKHKLILGSGRFPTPREKGVELWGRILHFWKAPTFLIRLECA